MMEDEEWKNKILRFDYMMQTSSTNETANEDLLFDVLQDLFSEDLKESTRLQLLLLLQQYEEQLVGDIDKAIQVCGSLLNVYDFLSNHLVLLKTQVLVTVTGICINFDLLTESETFYTDFVALLINIVIKVKSGHPLLCKTASDCLRMFEDANPGLLLKHFQNLMNCLKNDKTFAFYSHILVIASILNNTYKKDSQHTVSADGTNIDLNKSITQLIRFMNSLSSSGLVFVLRKIIPCLPNSKISKSILNNLLLYCMPSWDLARVYVYIYFQRNYEYVFHTCDDTDIISVIAHLTMLLDRNRLTTIHVLIVQNYIYEYIQAIQSSITYTEACLIASQALEPSIYTQLQYFPGKVSTLLKILKRNSAMVMSYEKQAMVIRVLVNHSKHMHWYDKMSDLFFSLYMLYKYGSTNIQDSIIQVVETLTIGSLKLAMYTIDFCTHIENHRIGNASTGLLTNIVQGLVCLDEKDIFSDLKSFFLILERAASVKDICPLQIIESLKGVAKQLAHQTNNWHDGSLLLSICRNMIINYDEEKIRKEISTLLWYISTSFPSRFIHDRAMAYYLIIGKMSPDHYKAVLTSSLSNQSIVKTDSEVTDMAEAMTQGPLLIRKLKKNYLYFTIKEPIVNVEYVDSIFDSMTKNDIIEKYNADLMSNTIDKCIRHKCVLSIDADEPKNIYAIQLDLFTIGGPFEAESMYCPFLIKSKSEEVCVSLKPQLPVVASFEIRATFIDEKHNSWLTYLDPFRLEFKHLFKPFQYGQNDRNLLFKALWSHFEDNESIPVKAPSLSVKNIGLVARERVYEHLNDFIVSLTDDLLEIGIYLPPRNHILLKFQFNFANTVVWIATDDVMLLECIDNYLEELSY